VAARTWGAPRIEQAAVYVEKDLGPRVGTALHRSADMVEPVKQRGRRAAAIGLLAVGSAAAMAGAGVMVLRRLTKQEVEPMEEPVEGSDEQAEGSEGSEATTSVPSRNGNQPS
jgi:hypothetical protein